jgi:hypothetical protein
MLGVFLEATDPPRYAQFVLWVWALSPCVRRLSDHQAGWQDPSVIILTPYLVTAICVAQMIMRSIVLRTRAFPVPAGRVMFLLIEGGAAIGVPMGMLAAPSAAALEGLNWLLPPLFGWWLAAVARPRIAEMEEMLRRAVFDIAAVAGTYAVYQFAAIPPWDAEWMRNVEMTSIGIPEPFAVRVFGTFHAPGVLAMFLVVPLALWLARPNVRQFSIVCVSSVALLLSQVRAAWIGFCLAAVLVMVRLPPRARLRAAILVPVACLTVILLMASPEAAEIAQHRIASFTSPSNDDSAVSRLTGHAVAFGYAAQHPFGAGIGISDPEMDKFMGKRDSMFVAALVQFGVIGATIYLLGFCALTAVIWRYYRVAERPDALGLAAAGIGLLSTAFFGTATAPSGVVLWAVAGVAAGSRATGARAILAQPTAAVSSGMKNAAAQEGA